MKKKLLFFVAAMVMLVCAFALCVSAAEPDQGNECVTLDDGTVCPIWDTDGNPLIWYVTSNEGGVKSYDYIAANDDAVDYYSSYTSSTGGITWYQLTSITITVNDTSYKQSSIAVLNMKGDDVVFTSGKAASHVGKPINCMSKVFTGSTNLEYAYLPLCMVDLNGENFKNCTSLKYVNLSELTELREIGSQDFNLGNVKHFFEGKVLDLSKTQITSIAGNGFACCSATEIILPSTLTSVGADAFKSCKFATKITFNGTLTSLSTGNLFSGCNALEEIAGFNIPAGTTSIGGSAFRYCYALKNAGDFIVDGILYLPEGVNTINTFAFSECKAIEAIICPSTLTYVGQQGFSYMDNVKIVSMERITGELTLHNCGHFRGLKNLVAVSLPEGMVEVSNRAFADCTNLTAVYMPNSVKYLCSNGGGQGSFCNSSKMYFVQESFKVEGCIVNGKVDTSLLTLPQKPQVYYMPTSLLTFTGHTYTNDTWCNATVFKNCYAINDVLVFPESFTKMTTMRPFENMASAESPKTIVFLGDIQEFAISHQSRYISFIFANKNDEGFEDLGIKRVTGNSNEAGSNAFFCSTGMKYDLAVSGRVGSGQDPTTEENIANIKATLDAINATAAQESLHIVNPRETKVTDAACTTIGGTTYYCFCGEKVAEEKTEDALGHKKSAIVAVIYGGESKFFETGDITYRCDRCNSEHTIENEAEVIFVARGYSYTQMGNLRKSIMQAFGVNRNALAIYNSCNNEQIVDYGVLAATEKGLNGTTDVFGADGTVNTQKVNVASHFGRAFDLIEMKLSGLEGEKDGKKFADEKVYCCAYIQIKNGEEIDTYYASKGSDGKVMDSQLFGSVSFNELVG